MTKQIITKVTACSQARTGYRALFMRMAAVPRTEFVLYANAYGVILAEHGTLNASMLVRHVEAMTEQTMINALSVKLTRDGSPVEWAGVVLPLPDVGYLQHGTAPGPCRTESVPVKNEYADRWVAMFEGKWRRVHIQVGRTFIVYQGNRITIQIDGV